MSFEDHLRRQQDLTYQKDLYYARRTGRSRSATRAQIKARRYRRLCFLAVALLFLLVAALAVEVTAEPSPPHGETPAASFPVLEVSVPVETENAAEELAEPLDEPVEKYIGEFVISHYCCEQYAHICGTGDGITASGTEVTAYRSCAVDPDVIPLGSKVTIYMEDGRILRYIAEDTGGAIKGNRIDLALPTHEAALVAGMTTGSVYLEVEK